MIYHLTFIGYAIICVLLRHKYSSAEQCTTDGLVDQNCIDNYTYKNGQRELADQCCFKNGTWFCVNDADIHQCEGRSHTTDLQKGTENMTENPTGPRTTEGEIVRSHTTHPSNGTESRTENTSGFTTVELCLVFILPMCAYSLIVYSGFKILERCRGPERKYRSRTGVRPNYNISFPRASTSRAGIHRRERIIRHYWKSYDNTNAQNSLSSYDNQTNGHISNVSHIGDGYFIYTGHTSDTANNLSTISDGNINIRDGPPSYYSQTSTRDVTLLSTNDTLNSQEDPPDYYDQSNRIVVGVSHISNSALNIQGDPPPYDDQTISNAVNVGSVLNQDGYLSSHPLDDLPSYYDVFRDEQIALPHDELQSDDENYPPPDY